MMRTGRRFVMLGLALCFATRLEKAGGREPPEFARRLDVFFEQVRTLPSSRERDDMMEDTLTAFFELSLDRLAALDDVYIDRFGLMLTSNESHLRVMAANFLGRFGRRAERMLPLLYRLMLEATDREAKLIFRSGVHESEFMFVAITRIDVARATPGAGR